MFRWCVLGVERKEKKNDDKVLGKTTKYEKGPKTEKETEDGLGFYDEIEMKSEDWRLSRVFN